MPVALVRLYVDDELRRTDAMQVAEEPDRNESFFNLFKRQESSTSLVLSKVLAVGPDGSGGKMKIEVQPGTSAPSVIFSRQQFPHGNASVEFYAASSSLSKNDKVLVSPPKVIVSRKEEEGEEGELEESNDPRSKHYTGAGNSVGSKGTLATQQTGAAQIQALAEQKRKTNLKGPFIILQFGIKPYYCQADYFVGSYTLYQKLHQNRLDANAATIFDRKMSEDLFESEFPLWRTLLQACKVTMPVPSSYFPQLSSFIPQSQYIWIQRAYSPQLSWIRPRPSGLYSSASPAFYKATFSDT